eukprot:554709_1
MCTKQMTAFIHIDELLGKYYEMFGVDDYFDVEGTGRFMRYVLNQELNDEDIPIEEELGGDAIFTDCIYTHFDFQHFPMDNFNQTDKINVIFSIIQHCYKYNELPDQKSIAASIESNITRNSIHCICGERLTKITDKKCLYDGKGFYCNICCIHSSSSCASSIYWHCGGKFNNFHKTGYDVCDKCRFRYFKKASLDCSDSKCMKEEKVGMKYDHGGGGGHCNFDHCHLLIRLKQTLRDYHEHEHEYIEQMDSVKMLVILNDYFHFISEHQNMFDSFVNELDFCDMVQCTKYRRNNRDRTKNDTKYYGNDMHIVFGQIMDKIHCHFLHCYDIGNGFNVQEKQSIEDAQNDHDLIVNQQIMRMQQISSLKQQRLETYKINHGLYDRIKRYKELDTYKEVKHQKNESTNTTQIFSFGYNFFYGYPSYKGYDEELHGPFDGSISVKPRFHSLKEELMNNKFIRVTMEQYNSEYAKADIYIICHHCRKILPIKILDKPSFGYSVTYKKDPELSHIKMEYILSLMFYCNYDVLQRDFSRTHRENGGKEHHEFYWFGNYLKRAVAIYGRTNGRETQSFYHGVSEPLMFPQCCGGDNYSMEIDIYCPLSTSLSYAVATHFAGSDGLIVEFGGMKTYFSCGWLSDYSNEKECLFIQRVKGDRGLKISNIIDCQFNIEYNTILEALKIIKYIMCNIINVEDYQTISVISPFQRALIRRLVHNRLSRVISMYQPFTSLSPYGQVMCDDLFVSIQHLDIDYLQIKNVYSFIADILFESEYEWIDLNVVRLLMPNLRKISIRNIRLCSLVMDDINNIYLGNITTIFISVAKNSMLSIKKVIDEYSEIFSNKSMFVSGTLYSRSLWIYHCQEIEFLGELLDSLGTKYFKFTNVGSPELMRATIKLEIAMNAVDNTNEVRIYHQQIFHVYCLKTYQLHIDWRDFECNPDSSIFQVFYYEDCQWIHLEFIPYLFPKCRRVRVSNIRLQTIIFDRILQHLLEHNDFIIIIDIETPKKITCQELSALDNKLNKYALDNIVKSEVKGFGELYKVRDIIRQQHGSNTKYKELYYLDLQITIHATFKYKKIYDLQGFEILADGYIPRITMKKRSNTDKRIYLES